MILNDLLVERDDHIMTVKLNRPEVLNALREKTLHELITVFDKFADDEQARALILTGMGDRAFSAGGDIKEMVNKTHKAAAAFAHLAHQVIYKIEMVEKPVLAAVNGLAFGAGCDLAMACDLCIASERARFGEPPPSIGIITPFGGTQRLPRIIGPKRAKYLFFTGETLDANTAYQMGLVNKVVEHDHLLNETKKIIDKILVRAPIAVGFSKTLINSSMRQMLVDGDRLEEELYAKCFETRDQKEGMNAFIEKRKPVFIGE